MDNRRIVKKYAASVMLLLSIINPAQRTRYFYSLFDAIECYCVIVVLFMVDAAAILLPSSLYLL